MTKRTNLAWMVLALMAATAAAAQTTVTTSGGTTNTVPVFTGSATVGNSPISVSGSSVGIGIASPGGGLQIDGVYPNSGLAITALSATTGWGNLEIEDWSGDWLWGDNVGDFDIMSSQQINLSANAADVFTPQLSITHAGNVGIGTASPAYTLDVAGQIHSSVGGYVFPDGSTQTTAFIPANCGADYAEAVEVTGDRKKYEPGDLLVIDPGAPGKFLKSNQAYSTLVAGIYSIHPGFVGRKEPATPETSKTEVPMAMVGRVPTKVTAENGPIHVGDLLVTSSKMGYAMKGTDRSLLLGAVIGKALGSLDNGTGVIEVLVTLQ